MLDYAANAVAYWPIESLRAQFEETCALRGDDPREILARLSGTEGDVEQFWERVRANLQAGRLRLIFVSDSIPMELRRVVEFLDAQFTSTRVLAIEIKQYVGQGMQALVPRVVAQAIRPSGSVAVRAGQWEEGTFFERLAEGRDDQVVRVARLIIEWAHGRALRVDGGRGAKDGSLNIGVQRPDGARWFATIWTSGWVEIGFQQLRTRAPFDDEERRLELRERLNHIPGVAITRERIIGRPNMRLDVFVEPVVLAQLLEVLDWVAETIEQA